MTPPRKNSPRTTRKARRSRAGAVPVPCMHPPSASDAVLIAAAAIEAQDVVVVTRDHRTGELRLWCGSGDPVEHLRMAEYARGELLLSVLRRESAT